MKTLKERVEGAKQEMLADHDHRNDPDDGCPVCHRYFKLKDQLEEEEMGNEMDDDSGEPETLISDEPNDIDN